MIQRLIAPWCRRSLPLLAAALAGCASPPPLAPADQARLRDARFVLIGEVHDNAEQHRQRAALLRKLLADGRPTTVVFEQMDRTHDAALAVAPRDAEALATAGELDRAGWRWPLHRPLLAAAAEGGAVLRGGNLPVAEVRAIVREGLPAAPADVRAALQAPGWTPAAEALLEQEIDQGHCHALPDSMWAPMALAQRARDAAMAGAMLGSVTGPARPANARVVLIAGNGHVRSDWGVAFYLRQAGVPAGEIATLGYLEDGDDGGGAPFDIARHTPPADREDACAAFHAR